MTKVLFICGKARMRSPTAAHVTVERFGMEADFAGLSKDADEPLGQDHLEWVEIIAVMERRQVARLKQLFGAVPAGKKGMSLGIADKYAFKDPEVVALLEAKPPFVFTRLV